MDVNENTTNNQETLYKVEEIFPTTVMRVDGQNLFTPEEVEILKSEIDSIIEEKTHMQYDDYTPKEQSLPILFKPQFTKNTDLWQRLQNHFLTSCSIYLRTVQSFSLNQGAINFVGARAWFYKNDGQSQSSKDNPIHNHNPSFLSGVFYLDVPESLGNSGGTIFIDPRRPLTSSTRDAQFTPLNLTWVIFPGWLQHQSGTYSREEVKTTPRYVIAADSYVVVNS
jgi:hypothetical protein